MSARFGVDPTGTTEFIGALRRVALDDDDTLDCEVQIDEHTMVPGSTGTVPMTLPPGYHSMDDPEIRFTLVRRYPLTTDFSAFPLTVSGLKGLQANDEESLALFGPTFPGKATWLEGISDFPQALQNSLNCPVNGIPLALGWPTKIGAYAMFDYFRWFSGSQIVEETSDEMRFAKFVEKKISTMQPEEASRFDYKVRGNIMQDSFIQQNLKTLDGYSGTWFLNSASVVGDEIEVTTEMTMPLPFFMGPNLPIQFVPDGRLQFSLNTEFYRMFDAPMRFFSGFMDTASDSMLSQEPATVGTNNWYRNTVAPIVGLAFSSLCQLINDEGGLSYQLPETYDATGLVMFNVRALKLTARNVECLMGDESTVLEHEGRRMFPACSLFTNGITVFTRLSKMATFKGKVYDFAPSSEMALHVQRDQYVKSIIPASLIAGVVKGSSYRPTRLDTAYDLGDTGRDSQAVSADDEVYIVFNSTVPLPCLAYGPTFGIHTEDAEGDDYVLEVQSGLEARTVENVLQPKFASPQQNTAGMSYMVVLNAPMSVMSNSQPTESTGLTMGPGYSEDDTTALQAGPAPALTVDGTDTMVYPNSVRLENVRLGFTARAYKGHVLKRLTDAYESPEGINIGRIAPVFITYNQTTPGRQQVQFSTFMSQVGFLQFELMRTSQYGLGRDRMLPVAPFAEYSLQQGSYTVQANRGESQMETYGNKFPSALQNWSSGRSYLGVLTGTHGESDHFDRIATCYSNCYAAPVTVNLAALHRLRTWGVYYPMNTTGGMSALRNREDWTFTYTAADEMRFNSNELGFGTLPWSMANGGSEQMWAPSSYLGQYVRLVGADQRDVYQVFDTTAGLNMKLQNGAGFSPTYMVCTVWGKLQFVLQRSFFKTVVPATIVTVNS